MKHAKTTQLYSSPNGDTWFLVRDPATGTGFVRHKANIPAGGQVTDIPIDAFLSWPRSPEQEALLNLLGTQIPDALNAAADNAPTAVSSDGQIKPSGERCRDVPPSSAAPPTAVTPGLPAKRPTADNPAYLPYPRH